jgi:hypothetical protein
MKEKRLIRTEEGQTRGTEGLFLSLKRQKVLTRTETSQSELEVRGAVLACGEEGRVPSPNRDDRQILRLTTSFMERLPEINRSGDSDWLRGGRPRRSEFETR